MDLTGQMILAFLEEDDTRRVLFRVRPVLSAQGPVSPEDLEELEQDGFLRVAPDRQEQHSFKERMRSLGSLCVINLTQAETALGKVRPNKNYVPGRGESNRYIIYSDAVQALPTGLVYEVVSEERREYALTRQYYLRAGGRISGPHCPDGTLSCPVSQTLMPDCERLFFVELPDGTNRMFYWPEEAGPAEEPVRNPAPVEESAAAPAPDAPSPDEEAPSDSPASTDGAEGLLTQAVEVLRGALTAAGFAVDAPQAAHLLVLLMSSPRLQVSGDTPADAAWAKKVLKGLLGGTEDGKGPRILGGTVQDFSERRHQRFLTRPWPAAHLNSGTGLPQTPAPDIRLDLPVLLDACLDGLPDMPESWQARLLDLIGFTHQGGRPLPLHVRATLAQALRLGSLLPEALRAGLFEALVISCAQPFEKAQGFGRSLSEEFLTK